jgi:hypothetical protein
MGKKKLWLQHKDGSWYRLVHLGRLVVELRLVLQAKPGESWWVARLYIGAHSFTMNDGHGKPLAGSNLASAQYQVERWLDSPKFTQRVRVLIVNRLQGLKQDLEEAETQIERCTRDIAVLDHALVMLPL